MSAVGAVLDALRDLGLYETFYIRFASGSYMSSDDVISLLTFAILSLALVLLVRWAYVRVRHGS